MSKLVLQSVRLKACLFVLLPAALGSLVGILLLIFIGIELGYSTLLGALVWLIPNMLFAYRLFSNVSVRAARKIIVTFYLFEAIKLLLTVALFIGIIKFLPIRLGYFFLGYALTLVMFWLMPIFYEKVKAYEQ